MELSFKSHCCYQHVLLEFASSEFTPFESLHSLEYSSLSLIFFPVYILFFSHLLISQLQPSLSQAPTSQRPDSIDNPINLVTERSCQDILKSPGESERIPLFFFFFSSISFPGSLFRPKLSELIRNTDCLATGSLLTAFNQLKC